MTEYRKQFSKKFLGGNEAVENQNGTQAPLLVHDSQATTEHKWTNVQQFNTDTLRPIANLYQSHTNNSKSTKAL